MAVAAEGEQIWAMVVSRAAAESIIVELLPTDVSDCMDELRFRSRLRSVLNVPSSITN